MRFNYKVPGVYPQEILLKAEARLPTGVPGFIGFASPLGNDETLINRPVELYRKVEFDTKFQGLPEEQGARPESYLAEAVAGFFLNGGERCFVVCARWEAGWDTASKESALKEALAALETVDQLDLVAVPDAMTLYEKPGHHQSDLRLDANAIVAIQRGMLAHCEAHGGRLAILDALPILEPAGVKTQRDDIALGMAEPLNGALYYPWLKAGPARLVPPCGHVAGIVARSDARTGVFKAPANEEVLGVLDLGVLAEQSGQLVRRAIRIDNSVQDQLNPEGINCLRAFPGRGIRVWGARTISREPDWRYINVRRVFLTLYRWIELNMAWANFEPHTPALWVRINRALRAYLSELWKAGALSGQTAEQAFYVKCDSETNPPELRDTGQLVTEIGLALSAPAEFVVVRVIHHTAVEPS
ncbi:MAG: phage tail sheath subtilisin-like domain-containing protein [Pyrinomonadaceae bacterium]